MAPRSSSSVIQVYGGPRSHIDFKRCYLNPFWRWNPRCSCRAKGVSAAVWSGSSGSRPEGANRVDQINSGSQGPPGTWIAPDKLYGVVLCFLSLVSEDAATPFCRKAPETATPHPRFQSARSRADNDWIFCFGVNFPLNSWILFKAAIWTHSNILWIIRATVLFAH